MGLLEMLFFGAIGTFSGPNQTLVHSVNPTNFIKSGTVTLHTGPDINGLTTLDINFDLKATWFSPVGDQKGTTSQALPTKFFTEQGYREIERAGLVSYDGVTITHLGRLNLGEYRNMHKVQIDKSGKWQAIAYFHPEIPAAGWSDLAFTAYNVPVVGSYTIESQMRR